MSDPAAADGNPNQDPSAPVARDVEIVNKKGLHARASAKFVQYAEQFDAEVTVTRGSESVGGTSIMGLMMLAAAPGISITIKATGKEAAEAVERCARWWRAGSGRVGDLTRSPSIPAQAGTWKMVDIKKSLYMHCGPRARPVIGTAAAHCTAGHPFPSVA